MMVTKKKKKTEDETSRVKVKKLKLNKETVKDLTSGEQKQVKGGLSLVSGNFTLVACTNLCPSRNVGCTVYCPIHTEACPIPTYPLDECMNSRPAA